MFEIFNRDRDEISSERRQKKMTENELCVLPFLDCEMIFKEPICLLYQRLTILNFVRMLRNEEEVV